MTEAQLKKLDDAVTLQRDIGTCNERLEALKADLIREARSHKEDFTIIEAAVCVRCTLESSLPSHDLSTGLFFGSWRSGSRLFSLAFTPSSYSLITPGLIWAWFGRASAQLFFSLNCVPPGRSSPGGLT